MPEEISMYKVIWSHIQASIVNGIFAVTQEIYEEQCYLLGNTGQCIRNNKEHLVLEVGQDGWDWENYLRIVEDMRTRHKSVISEYNGNRKGTVGLNDISIVALGKCLRLPVISMESLSYQASDTKIRIPRLCNLENVEHHTFNDFLIKEGF